VVQKVPILRRGSAESLWTLNFKATMKTCISSTVVRSEDVGHLCLLFVHKKTSNNMSSMLLSRVSWWSYFFMSLLISKMTSNCFGARNIGACSSRTMTKVCGGGLISWSTQVIYFGTMQFAPSKAIVVAVAETLVLGRSCWSGTV